MYISQVRNKVANCPPVKEGVIKDAWKHFNVICQIIHLIYAKGTTATTVFLERFFENLLMGYQNDLKNRYIHVDYNTNSQSAIQSVKADVSKCKNCTLEELAILKIQKKNPSVTQKELAKALGKSERTIKTRTVEMQKKGLIQRENGKRNGRWEVLIEVE